MVSAQKPDATPEWYKDARCRGVDTSIFFPERGEDSLAAKGICAECKHKLDCREYSIHTREEYGIWGEWSGRQRRGALIQRNREEREKAS